MPVSATLAVVAATSTRQARGKLNQHQQRALDEDDSDFEEDDGTTAASTRSSVALPAESEEDKAPASRHWLLRMFGGLLEFFNNTLLQFGLYIVYVIIFQLLADSLRNPEEYFFDKMIADTFLDNEFDALLHDFSDIRRPSDFYEWGNTGKRSGLSARRRARPVVERSRRSPHARCDPSGRVRSVPCRLGDAAPSDRAAQCYGPASSATPGRAQRQ